tara:strand:- start:248 stop:796 length:549 start_codon:yes stop_codon:yes gene_type:complete
MPALNPTAQNKTYSPLLATLPEEATKTEIKAENSSTFFSRRFITTAGVGFALGVTAYFSAPIAIAATFAIGVTASAYYGVTALVNYFKKSDRAPENTDTPASTTDANNDTQNAQSNTYSRVHQATHGTTKIKDKTTEDTKEEAKSEQLETTPVIKQNEQSPEKPVATQEQGDSLETTSSHRI